MPLRFYLIRLTRYYNKYGLQGTLKRIKEKIALALFQRDDIVFYFDLIFFNSPVITKPDSYKIEAKSRVEEIDRSDMDSLNNHIGAEIISYQLNDRFSISAILWIIKVKDDLAGYVWSVASKSKLSPSYIPLCNRDVYLFDGGVMERHRGKNIYPVFISHVIFELKKLGFVRAFFVAHEWNKSVLRSFSKIQAQTLGVARKYSFGGREFITWKH